MFSDYTGYALVALLSAPPIAVLFLAVSGHSLRDWRRLLQLVGLLMLYALVSALGLRSIYPYDILVLLVVYFCCYAFILKQSLLGAAVRALLSLAAMTLFEGFAFLVTDALGIVPESVAVMERVYTSGYVVAMNAAFGVFCLAAAYILLLCRRLRARLSQRTLLGLQIGLFSLFIALSAFCGFVLLLRYINSNDIASVMYFLVVLGAGAILYAHYIWTHVKLYRSMAESTATARQVALIYSLTEELHRFKHNYLNILYGFGGHLATQDTAALLQYYNETVAISQVINNDNIVSMHHVQNAALVGLLKQHLDLCLAQNIPFYINVSQPFSKLYMREPDLCQLLGIFLDNAREATAKTDAPYIKLDILAGERELEFYLYNTFNQADRRSEDGQRGRGLVYAREIVRRSRRAVNNTYQQDDYFVQQLVLRG